MSTPAKLLRHFLLRGRCAHTAAASAALYTTEASLGPCYAISPDQEAVQQLARRYTREEVVPRAAEWDRTGEFPWDAFLKLHSLGLMTSCVPKKYGGTPLDGVTESLVCEELSYGCTGFTQLPYATKLAQIPVVTFGSDDLQRRYLGRMVDEPHVASYCVTEPGGGSDVAALRTHGVRRGAEWVLNGQKMWITNAGHAQWYFVLARTDPDLGTPAKAAMTGFIVDRDTPGLTIGRKEINMGQRCSDVRGITFEDVVVPQENVCGPVGDGFNIAMKVFDRTRPFTASYALGIMKRCLEEATKYAMERKAFGVPIAEHQTVSMMLSEMAMNLELARLATYQAAWEYSEGRRNSYMASVGKKFAADAAMKAAIDCVQIFGGNGFNTEYPAEKLMRDAKVIQIYEGTAQIQSTIIHKQWMNRMKGQGLIN